MNYPIMNNGGYNSVTVPLLSGGINAADPFNLIKDNQLVDSVNMWMNGEQLVTRPKTQIERILSNGEIDARSIKSCDCFFDGVKKKALFYLSSAALGVKATLRGRVITPGEHESSEFTVAENITVNPYMNFIILKGQTTCGGSGIFIVLREYEGDAFLPSKIFELISETEVKEVDEDEVYKPLRFMNGKGESYNTLPTNEQTLYSPSTLFEGQNILTGGFRASFISDGVSSSFYLPFKVKKGKPLTVFVDFSQVLYGTDADGCAVFKFDTSTSADEIETENSYAHIKMTVGGHDVGMGSVEAKFNYEKNVLSFISLDVVDGKEMILPFAFPFSGAVDNNITVYGYEDLVGNDDLLMGMTLSESYGGADGLYKDGSRVFVSGNPKAKNLLYWSDTDKPLYFSANNYIYIGDPDEAVTALAKQDGFLAVFKEHSVYCLEKAGNINVTDTNSIVDVTADTLYSVKCINDTVGCDLKNTVRLCLNRLVWANSTGEVYTLVSTYTGSRQNIYSVSRNIEKYLKKDDLKNAFALDFCGYYMLFCREFCYLLDYNRSSYKYVASYTRSSEKSQREFTWWKWKFDLKYDDGKHVLSVKNFYDGVVNGDDITLICIEKSGDSVYRAYTVTFDMNECDRCGCMIQSKMFDFSLPQRKKSIGKMTVRFSNKYQSVITPVWLTDSSETDGLPIEIISDSKMYSNRCGEVKRINVHSAARAGMFGFKLCSDSPFAIDFINIEYKVLGGIK